MSDEGDDRDELLSEVSAFVMTVGVATVVYWYLTRAALDQILVFAVVLAAVYLLVRVFTRRLQS